MADAQQFQGLSDLGPAECATSFKGWRAMLDVSSNRSRKIKGGNYVQIATVDESGLPKCRTVVFRGFIATPHGEAMKMITDARSEKVAQVQRAPACEMVWWFAKTSEQYRISGILQLVGAGEAEPTLAQARSQQWGNLSDPAREQFFWYSPGVPFAGAPEDVPAGGRDAEGRVVPAPDTFLLLLLHPQQVKYLRLGDNHAYLDSKNVEGEWESYRVNP